MALSSLPECGWHSSAERLHRVTMGLSGAAWAPVTSLWITGVQGILSFQSPGLLFSVISYPGARSLETPGPPSWLPPPSWVIAELGAPELGHTDGCGC